MHFKFFYIKGIPEIQDSALAQLFYLPKLTLNWENFNPTPNAITLLVFYNNDNKEMGEG
jgi:hypothetical protein